MQIDWFPLWLSLRVAALATAISLVVGLWLAYLLANREFRGKEALDAAVTLPLVLPPTVLGYYLLVCAGPRERPRPGVRVGLGRAAGVHLAGGGGGGDVPRDSPAGEVGAGRARERGPQLRARGAQPGRVGVARVLARDAAAGAPVDSGGGGAGVRALAGRFRHHHHDRGQHSGPHADARGGHLRRRRSRQRSAGADAGAGHLGGWRWRFCSWPTGWRARQAPDAPGPHSQALSRGTRLGRLLARCGVPGRGRESPCCSGRAGRARR